MLMRKTYTLGPGLIDQLGYIVSQAAENDLNVSESTVVRLALIKGLPLVCESLGLEVKETDDGPETQTV